MKFLFVTGGVISGVGKGTSAASLNLLMKMRGISTEMIKFDGYLNLSAGTLNPYEHGNVVVLDDGTECDLDMSHYEFLGNADLSSKNIYTSGRLMQEIVEEETNGKWLGKTIQYLPHYSQKIQDKLTELAKNVDLVVCEIGGTVSDNESWIYYHAIRELRQKLGFSNVAIVHVSFVLYLNIIKEFKTKPLQLGINSLRKFGLDADILLCRAEQQIPIKILNKISNLTGIPKQNVLSCPDVKTVYQIPIHFHDNNIDEIICRTLNIEKNPIEIEGYRDLVEKYIQNSNTIPEIIIGIIGKYTSSPDTYFTLKEAVLHASIANNVKTKIKWINSEELETTENFENYFENVDGVIIPGGFDKRGVEGKTKAVTYCRENKIPILGICLGLQCMAIEIARNICGFYADSYEFDRNADYLIVHYVDGQEGLKKKSGTMRLGAYDCELIKDSIAYGLYKKKIISERHRHRCEINQKYLSELDECGFKVSGFNPGTNLVEIMELEDHPYFIGTQSHPEFKSKLGDPAPLFFGLIKAAINQKTH